MIAHGRRYISVTPFAGVWIEIIATPLTDYMWKVTPFAGVWIEMDTMRIPRDFSSVTPFAGVWIEIIWRCFCVAA